MQWSTLSPDFPFLHKYAQLLIFNARATEVGFLYVETCVVASDPFNYFIGVSTTFLLRNGNLPHLLALSYVLVLSYGTGFVNSHVPYLGLGDLKINVKYLYVSRLWRMG